MKNFSVTNPIFHNEELALQYLESIRWSDGITCPHCGGMDKAYKLKGASTRKGLYKCGHCRKPFTVTIGTVYERSHIPIHKWLLATHLMCSSKKGISAHQIHRMLDITYKSAWFMCHRIREGMKISQDSGKLGGSGKVIEADETFFGSKKNLPKGARGYMHKEKIFSLVERKGYVRSFHVDRVDGDTLKPILKGQVYENTKIMTDDMGAYSKLDTHFDSHDVVRHSKGEYVRGKDIHTNTIEGFFSILKRGLTGIYQHVWKFHLQRYITEFDFRYSHRKISDFERFNIALKWSEGKRLTYYQAMAV